MIKLQKTYDCSLSDLYSYWTNSDKLKLFFGADNHIELKKQGAYEIYFNLDAPKGEQGSEGCRIIHFEANRLLQFTWNAPPSIPEVRYSGKFTQVNIDFNPISEESSELILRHDGWNYEGKAWEDTHKYFEKAWPYVLDSLTMAIQKIKNQ